MPAEQPTSPIAARVLRRVTKALVGEPTVLGADLGNADLPDIKKTTGGDDPALRSITGRAATVSNLWTNEADATRRARYLLYHELRRIPEVKQILRILVAFVFGGDPATGQTSDKPFEIDYGDGLAEEDVDKLKRAVANMRLFSHVPQQFESGLLLGDSFGEVIHSLVEALALRPMLARDTEVIHDVYDRLVGYRAHTRSSASPQATSMGSRFMSPLQVVAYCPHKSWGDRYGESIFFGLPDVGRQYQSSVDIPNVLLVLAATARTRVAMQVPKGWAEIDILGWLRKMRMWNADGAFFDSNGKMHKALASLLDYADKVWPYYAGQAKPEFWSEPAPDFDKLLKVAKFNQGRLYLGVGFPKALAGLLDDAHSRAALAEQGMYLSRTLRFYQQDVALLVLEYIARAAVIAGVHLDPDSIVVRMPMLGEFNEELIAKVLKLRADTALALGSLGVPMRWLLTSVLRVPSDAVDDLLLAAGTSPNAASPEMPEEALAKVREVLGGRIEELTEQVALATTQVEVTLREMLDGGERELPPGLKRGDDQ